MKQLVKRRIVKENVSDVLTKKPKKLNKSESNDKKQSKKSVTKPIKTSKKSKAVSVKESEEQETNNKTTKKSIKPKSSQKKSLVKKGNANGPKFFAKDNKEVKSQQLSTVQKIFEKAKSHKNAKGQANSEHVDWNEFKKKMKIVRTKRKQTNTLYDAIVKAKKISEKLRLKTLPGGDAERTVLTTELHELLGRKGDYPKLVMTHDMGRIVQYLLKFAIPQIRKEIAQELLSVVVTMLQSKYAKYCVKRMLKYGDPETQSAIIKACYGKAVKLCSHAVSSDVFEYAFSTWASPLQKQHLVQEFYGEMYKQAKDDSVKHVRDVYAQSPEMKTATLEAVKHNLQRILNKELFDSQLVHTVLLQYMQECEQADRCDLVSQLASHFAILSNSKDGSKVAIMCIWYGTNKDRKISIKSLKENIIALCTHEHGHCVIITLLNFTDDTVLLNKALLSTIVSRSTELVVNEWGRKILSWLVAPGDTAYFHPKFLGDLNEGRKQATSKKDPETLRKDILGCVYDLLLKQIAKDPKIWTASSSVALVTLAILKAGSSVELKPTFIALGKQIIDSDWTIKDGEKEVLGIEHTGLHMVLKKLIQYDKTALENIRPEFGATLVDLMDDKTIEKWVTLNRGCFLLITIIESNSTEVQVKLKKLLNAHLKLIKKQSTLGAKILLKKLN